MSVFGSKGHVFVSADEAGAVIITTAPRKGLLRHLRRHAIRRGTVYAVSRARTLLAFATEATATLPAMTIEIFGRRDDAPRRVLDFPMQWQRGYCHRDRVGCVIVATERDPEPGDPCPKCDEILLGCSPAGRGTAACDGCQTVYGDL